METFTARSSWLELIRNLCESERGRLFTALLTYAKTGEAQELRGNEKVVYPAIIADIEADVQNAQNLHINAQEKYINNNLSQSAVEERIDLSVSFKEFWDAYPVKVNKKRCSDLWNKIKPDKELLRLILKKIEAFKQSRNWREGFIPYPDTWLRGERWNDELPPEPVRRQSNRSVSGYAQRPISDADIAHMVVDFGGEA